MSMTNVESWSVDLSTIGPIYPMVGSEGVLLILGLIFWLGWHIWQIRFENRTFDAETKMVEGPGQLEKMMRESIFAEEPEVRR